MWPLVSDAVVLVVSQINRIVGKVGKEIKIKFD